MTIRRDERGSSLIEFAILLPVFLVIVFGSFSLLWMLTARSALSGAARDGARFASIRHDPLACEAPPCPTGYPTKAEVAAVVRDRAGHFDVDTVTLVPPTRPNEALTVTVTGKLPALVQAIAWLFGDTDLEFSTDAKARAE